VLGEAVNVPLVLAPTGLTGLLRSRGETMAAQAAAEAGIPYCLSTMSVCSLEELAGAVQRPFWFQLYMMKDRGFVRALVERAHKAGCPVLVLTADVPVLGQRHRDLRNGFTVPLSVGLGTALDFASRPAWALRALRAGWPGFGNLAGHVDSGSRSLPEWIATQFDGAMTWSDVGWLREVWPGKLVVKGVLNAQDARAAVGSGADAVVVSNHGGRQLDGAPSAISALAPVVQALGGDAEVLVDSGFRTGQDVMRALALGARGCMIGRAFLYGLAAGGRPGVARAIEIIRKELDSTMALCGVRSIAEIDRRVLAASAHQPAPPPLVPFLREARQ
jgi:L-lactate dehydrogenase (cytochrome)